MCRLQDWEKGNAHFPSGTPEGQSKRMNTQVTVSKEPKAVGFNADESLDGYRTRQEKVQRRKNPVAQSPLKKRVKPSVMHLDLQETLG
jgi:hypothetical protein